MITIITGLPGSGKTAMAVGMVREWAAEGRPVFASGVSGLRLDHTDPGEPSSWVSSSSAGAQYVLPARAVLLVDEAQRVFRPRASTSAVPPWVSALETHRHTGIDVVLVTQAPELIDTHVRRLCGRHIHLEHRWAGRRRYEWSRVADVTSRADREQAACSAVTLDRSVFSLYSSAEVHTVTRRRAPRAVWVLGVSVVLVAGGGAWLYSSLSSRFWPSHSGSAPSSPAAPVASGVVGGPRGERPRLSWAASQVPEASGLAFTAPRYAEVTAPVRAPVPAACVSSGARCECWSQDATRLDVPVGVCREIVAGGFFQDFGVGASSGPGSAEGARSGPAVTVAPAVAAQGGVIEGRGLVVPGGAPGARTAPQVGPTGRLASGG